MISRRSTCRTAAALVALVLLATPGFGRPTTPSGAVITLPEFPLPKFAVDAYGQRDEASSTRLLRAMFDGGVHGIERFEAVDSDYAIISRSSLGLLSAWLESSCQSIGVDVTQARAKFYNGSIYAEFLEVVTSIAADRVDRNGLAIPLGVLICQRTHRWGALPGDGARDAYVVLMTEDGFVVYDPPTRQSVSLADFPNAEAVVKIRL